MNLKEFQEQFILILSKTTPAEIYAGMLENEIIPKFLKTFNLSEKPISQVLEEYIDKVSIDHNIVQQPNLQKIIGEYKILEDKLSILNSTELLLNNFSKEFEKIFVWSSCENFKTDSLFTRNEKLNNIYNNLNSRFKSGLENIVSSEDIKLWCDEECKKIISELIICKSLFLNKMQEIKDAVQNVKAENEIDLLFYQKEESALEFFYKIFLKENIQIRYDFNSFKTNKVTDRAKSDMVLNNFLKKEVSTPGDWRSYFSEILSQKIPNFRGENNGRFNKECLKLSNVDYSYLLALKNAIACENEIITENNEIFLAISGGMMAKIVFSEKGSFVEKFQESEVEMYYQKSYTYQNIFSNVMIECPNKWFILTKDFLVEVSFQAAPVLFGNFPLSIFSSKITKEKEKEDYQQQLRDEEEEEEEENNRSTRKNYY